MQEGYICYFNKKKGEGMGSIQMSLSVLVHFVQVGHIQHIVNSKLYAIDHQSCKFLWSWQFLLQYVKQEITGKV